MNALTKSNIEELDNIEFHDLCLKDMNFHFQSQTFTITFEELDQLSGNYFPLTLTFEGVTKFLSDYPSDKIEFKPHGCYEATYHITQEGSCEIKFLLELWRDVPAWELTIGFRNVLIQRTQSFNEA